MAPHSRTALGKLIAIACEAPRRTWRAWPIAYVAFQALAALWSVAVHVNPCVG